MLDASKVAQETIKKIYDGITTEELDLESAKVCANMNTTHSMYNYLAGRINVSNLHKNTLNSFVEKQNLIQNLTKKNSSNNIGILDERYLKYVNDNAQKLESIIDYKRDFNLDFFGYKTLERAYLLKNPKTRKIIERPQDMFLRVSTFINMGNIEKIESTYNLMSMGFYTHATPTLFNSGTRNANLSSCFLIGTKDSMDGITDTWKQVSMISKWSGGIGLHISNIRAKGSLIRGTNGESSGIIPMLQVYNNIARYVNQGGKRKGSIAVYLEPHHPDIFQFLDLRKNFGAETERARDLFLALWVSDLFMKKVDTDGDWYLMCPDECPGLSDVWGKDYEDLYWSYVEKKQYKKKIKARDLMRAIIEAQIETGTPYITYKDAANAKSNQKNLGTIKSSNLCNEIIEYSDDKETAVCNLASIAISKCVKQFEAQKIWTIYTKEDCKYCRWAKNYMTYHKFTFVVKKEDIREVFNVQEDQKISYPQILYGSKRIGGFSELIEFTKATFDYDKLYQVAYLATENLNNVIDVNFYPTSQSKLSNMKHRPIGLGIQGLADTLAMMRIPYESEQSIKFNQDMMETIYFAAMTASKDIAKKRSEMSRLWVIEDKLPTFYDHKLILENDKLNKLYHELKPNKYELKNTEYLGAYSSFKGSPLSEGKFQFDLWGVKPSKWDWESLRKEVLTYGVRNSLLTALMPTASTSQILGNNECFEYFTNNIYTRRTLAGDFVVVNKHMINDLTAIGEWSYDLKQNILACDGSVKSLNIPVLFKQLYKTIWEIKQVWSLKNALARAPYVDQTQSMNIFMDVPDSKRLYSAHMWGWKKGLKTGMYYLRTKPATSATKFTVEPDLVKDSSAFTNRRFIKYLRSLLILNQM